MEIRLSTFWVVVYLATGAPFAFGQCLNRAQGMHGNDGAKVPFVLSISSPRSQARSTEDIEITITYSNISDHRIGLRAVALDDTRSLECFEVFDNTGKLVASRMLVDQESSMNMKEKDASEGSMRSISMNPGENHISSVDLSKYYHLDQAGKYTVRFHTWSWDGNVWVSSNTITIVLVP